MLTKDFTYSYLLLTFQVTRATFWQPVNKPFSVARNLTSQDGRDCEVLVRLQILFQEKEVSEMCLASLASTVCGPLILLINAYSTFAFRFLHQQLSQHTGPSSNSPPIHLVKVMVSHGDHVELACSMVMVWLKWWRSSLTCLQYGDGLTKVMVEITFNVLAVWWWSN